VVIKMSPFSVHCFSGTQGSPPARIGGVRRVAGRTLTHEGNLVEDESKGFRTELRGRG